MRWLKLSRFVSQRRNVVPQNGAQIRVQSAELYQPDSSWGKQFWTTNFARFLNVSDTNPRTFLLNQFTIACTVHAHRPSLRSFVLASVEPVQCTARTFIEFRGF